MRSRSPKPRVTKKATREPLRSSRAFVARVVARRNWRSGNDCASDVRVKSRAPRTGAASPVVSSKVVPIGKAVARDADSSRMIPLSDRDECTVKVSFVSSTKSRKSRKKSSGNCHASLTRREVPLICSISETLRTPLESTFTRCSVPSGARAWQSVKVPPVSAAIRQFMINGVREYTSG